MEVEDGLRLPTEVEQLVFRTAQEALRNAGAHAAAGHVDLDVHTTGSAIMLRVRDDGCGFDAAEAAARRSEGHLGLSMLRDLSEAAGGRLTVDSAPGAGTTVQLEVPLR
jgi:signal transduction histidine kinase